MKKILFIIFILVGSYSISYGQNSATINKSRSSSTQKHTAKTAAKKRTIRVDTLNNRKNYQWKDGQKATPTGEEATGSNSDNFASLKNDTMKLKKNYKKG